MRNRQEEEEVIKGGGRSEKKAIGKEETGDNRLGRWERNEKTRQKIERNDSEIEEILTEALTHHSLKGRASASSCTGHGKPTIPFHIYSQKMKSRTKCSCSRGERK